MSISPIVEAIISLIIKEHDHQETMKIIAPLLVNGSTSFVIGFIALKIFLLYQIYWFIVND